MFVAFSSAFRRIACCKRLRFCFNALRISASWVLSILRRSIFCSCDMRFISGQNVWDCDLLGGVIPIEEAAASSMAFTTYFSCVCAVSAASI